MRRATVFPILPNRALHFTLTSAVVVLAMATAGAALQGRVLSLDGQGDFMEVADSPALHATDGLTLTTWFRVDDR